MKGLRSFYALTAKATTLEKSNYSHIHSLKNKGKYITGYTSRSSMIIWAQIREEWEYFLGKATTPQGAPVYSRSDIKSLVEKLLNGREVRSSYYVLSGIECSSSCTSTAHALALQEGAQVTMSHLEFAIDAGEDFGLMDGGGRKSQR